MTTNIVTPLSAFGAGNLSIEETDELVTIKFDPRVVIGVFSSGRQRIASTGTGRVLDRHSGIKIALNVMGRLPEAKAKVKPETE